MRTGLMWLALPLVAVALAACGRTDGPASDAVTHDTPQVTPSQVVEQPATLRVHSGTSTPERGGYCSLDAFNGGDPASASARAGTDASFVGWLADADLSVPSEAMLVLRGEGTSYALPVRTGGARPDVAAALTSDTLAGAGFGVSVPLDVVPGAYSLSVVVNQDENRECDLNKRLQVEG